MVNFENLDKMGFDGVGRYDIPVIQPEYDTGAVEKWLPFNYARTSQGNGNTGLHCFVDDYQFARLWNRPDDYLDLLSRFGCVCAPDFSTYTDMPVAMQIYNHYRKHWVAAYWQAHGLKVIPTVSWSDESSFEWCFDGEPRGGIVVISSVGCVRNKEAARLFSIGFEEMKRQLSTTVILCHGSYFPEGCIGIKPYYNEIAKKRKEQKNAEKC